MRMKEFDLVIGGSGEIGGAIVKKLAAEGRNVICTYNSKCLEFNRNNNPENSCKAKVLAVKANVRSSHDITALEERVRSEGIILRSLVYASGIINDRLFNNMSENDFDEVMDINLYGCVRVCKAFINEIAVNRGSVVFISSVSGLTGKVGQVNYSCSKAGMIALCRNLASEYASLGVRVNCVAPGLIMTKMIKSMPPKELDSLKRKIPLRCIGTTDDVAETVYFLISERSRYMTGQTLIVDGGLIMR